MPKSRSGRVALVLVLLMAATEIGVRILADRDSQWNVRLGAVKRFDPITQFRLQSNIQITEGVFTNEHGYLAPRGLTTEKPADELRVIYLGDSVTALPASGTYPSKAEEILEAAGLRVQTLNAAVPGYSTRNARALFESDLSRYDADYFFVNLGWNDLGQYGPEGMPYKRQEAGYELNPLQRFVTQIYTLRLLFAAEQLWRRSTPSVHAPLSPEDEALYASYTPSHYEENLRAILILANSRYPNVAIMRLATITSEDPTEDDLRLAHYPTGMDKNMRKLHRLVRQYNAVIDHVASDLDVPVVDLFGLFDSPEARREFTDSCHLTRDGAKRAARAVADFVLEREATRAATR
jgi:lysophospholipase L1-like esterase